MVSYFSLDRQLLNIQTSSSANVFGARYAQPFNVRKHVQTERDEFRSRVADHIKRDSMVTRRVVVKEEVQRVDAATTMPEMTCLNSQSTYSSNCINICFACISTMALRIVKSLTYILGDPVRSNSLLWLDFPVSLHHNDNGRRRIFGRYGVKKPFKYR